MRIVAALCVALLPGIAQATERASPDGVTGSVPIFVHASQGRDGSQTPHDVTVPHGATFPRGATVAQTEKAPEATPVPDAGRIGAAMGGDALQCGEAPAITSADAAEGLGSAAIADADGHAGTLDALSAKARETVANLNQTYALGEDATRRNYYVAVCQRLKEKGIGLETLRPILLALAGALDIPAPATAETAPNQPPASPGGAMASAARPTAEDHVTPAAPEAASPAAPTNDAAPLARATEARGTEAQVPDTTPEPAPAGVPQDQAAAAPPATGQAAMPLAPTEPARSEPGTEQPAAPETSTMAQGDAPAGPPRGALSPGASPEPVQASPGSVEEPGAAKTPAPDVAPAPSVSAEAPAPAPQPAPTAEAPAPAAPAPAPSVSAEAPTTAPQPAPTAEAPTPAAPAPAPSVSAEAPTTAPKPAPTAEVPAPAAPMPAPSVSAEAPTTAPQPAPTTAEAPAPAAPAPAPAVSAEAHTTAPQPAPTAEAPAPAAPAPVPAAALEPPAPAAPKLPLIGQAVLAEDQCDTLGAAGACAELNAALSQLLEKPLAYNRPRVMHQYQQSEIGLVLRTDWQGQDLPPDIADQLRGLPGQVQQALTKITRVMSAELTGGDFEIAPSGRQERSVVIPRPVTWTWQVRPRQSGEGKPLKLQLYAHVEGPGGTMPAILVKTLDASITVDVRMWDWVLAQARDIGSGYMIIAVLLGLLTVLLVYYFGKPAEMTPSARGPVIGDLDQTGGRDREDRGSGRS